MLRAWAGSVTSSGGLRSDFSVMERERSAPGVSFTFFARGRGIFGRIYCDLLAKLCEGVRGFVQRCVQGRTLHLRRGLL